MYINKFIYTEKQDCEGLWTPTQCSDTCGIQVYEINIPKLGTGNPCEANDNEVRDCNQSQNMCGLGI